MIILQRRRKVWYVVSLCYKVIFSYVKKSARFVYDPLSYKRLLGLSKVFLRKEEILYILPLICDRPSEKNLLQFVKDQELFYSDHKWCYLRERRRYSYTNKRFLFLLNNFYIILLKKIFKHYSFFFNSFFFKQLYFKNYSRYKNVHLVDFFCKIYFNDKNGFDFFLQKSEQHTFMLTHEYFTQVNYDVLNIQPYTCALEYFSFKKLFFKNSFYNFFLSKSSFLFLNNELYLDNNVNNDYDISIYYNYKGSLKNNFFFSKAEPINFIVQINLQYYLFVYKINIMLLLK